MPTVKTASTMPYYPLLLLAAAAAIFITAAAQQTSFPSPAPSPGLDCMPYLLNMSDCLSYVQNGSKARKPDKGCCPELANLVKMQPICLCKLLGNPESVGFPIDISRALKLPSVCHVTTPPVSLCATIGVPVAAFGPGPVAGGAPAPGMSVHSPSPRMSVHSPSPTVSGSDGIPSGSPSNGGSIAASPSPPNLITFLTIITMLPFF